MIPYWSPHISLSDLLQMPLFRESAMDASKAFEIAAIKKIAWRILPLILVAYCIAYVDRSNIALCRPTLTYLRHVNSRSRHALIGFGGGLIGGLTAMPGALPTIWCDMHGMPKNEQRGLVQPFIAVMQIFALTLMLSRNSLSSTFLIDFAISLPALAAGAVLGIVMFRRINEIAFRRIVLVVLLFSGLSLAI
jgi:uncharacterized membrane protein YfcA